jgi:hypothetical protein
MLLNWKIKDFDGDVPPKPIIYINIKIRRKQNQWGP